MKKQVTPKATGGKPPTSPDGPKPSRAQLPDEARLTKAQAVRLAALSGVGAAEFLQGSIAQVAEKLKWRIDPKLFLFQQICGQVVKTDPATGVDYPVPFATVHVEDTDCSFLGLFPIGSPWHWLFPIFCRREEIAAVQTDACGRFCVWVPRFEIDWILRWRLERHCYWDIFRRPTIQDILDHLKVRPEREFPFPPQPEPGPDPSPIDRLPVFQQIESLIGRERVDKLRNASRNTQLGGQTTSLRRLLNQPAFANPVPPPLPPEFSNDKEGQEFIKGLGLSGETARQVANFNPSRFLGPFLRCHTHLIPQWTPILDVPDITFRVTQDVNGDGTAETIYSESYFDVRWNDTSIPDVTLHASSIAVAAPVPADSPMCQQVDVPCETPAIVLAGLYPLHNLGGGAPPYLNSATGYAQRPNRPHPDATPGQVPPAGILATAPFCGVVQLYGCNQRAGTESYRLFYTHTPPGGSPSGPARFLGLTWPLWRWVGTPGHLEILNVAPDTQGWYEIIPDAQQWLPSHLLLNWPTGNPGLYRVQMEFADAAKTLIGGSQTPAIGLYVDNQDDTSPISHISEIRWRIPGEAGWNNHPALSRFCAVVPRPTGAALEFRVTYQAAARHLRNVSLWGSGCGIGNLSQLSAPAWSDPPSPATNGGGVSLNPYEHWHTGPLDNNISRAAIFSLGSGAAQGAYDFSLWVNSRAFNPAGGDGGFGPADWFYDPAPIYTHDNWKFALIDV